MVEQALAALLASHHTIKIATAGGPISPWVAAAFFVEDGLFTVDVAIEARGKTLANLRADPRAALMLENGNPLARFAQAEARARVLSDPTHEVAFRLAHKAAEGAALVSQPGLVSVRFEITRWLVTDVRAGWLPAKELRRPVGLPTLVESRDYA